ncbi:MAG: response regulator transcription factor [Peptoniphilaceae bacterium]|nr:response regulator transcription factor [Peptoniphilaceae bacterium]MDD7434512.1 response regulator transcription factor [Peptoniphilaceae bacterium]MDD7543105.1 response regulator transcription factor [Peptoniphilaceae bacterium]MDY3076133.1 response regulator transcription factor [Peptoniphilaceae bacterium]MDY4195877.1 response regulator transcription factor [Peptoniphilaceae bacterium]
MINVLIIEDQRMMRETMEMYVTQAEGYHLYGSFSAAGDAERFCDLSQVDLILMDICTEHDESGFVATKAIKLRCPKIKIIIVTSMLDAGYLNRAREVGADSIYFKDVSQTELMTVVEQTMRGESVYPEKTPEVRIGNIQSSEFTEAEVRVLHLMVEGMTYKEMAGELGVTADCVKKHISNMLFKTGFSSKTKLTAMVVSKRLIVNGF